MVNWFCWSGECKLNREEMEVRLSRAFENYQCKEEQLTTEQRKHFILKTKHDELVKENQRLAKALWETTDAYNVLAKKLGKKTPSLETMKEKLKKEIPKEDTNMNPISALGNIMAMIADAKGKKHERRRQDSAQ